MLGKRPIASAPIAGNIASAAASGWQNQLNQPPRRAAIAVAVIASGLAWLPMPAPAAPSLGWQAPLSAAPKVAMAQQGHAFVPFNTVQTQYAANYTNLGWYAPLSPAPAVAQARQGNSYVPFNTAQLAAPYGIPLDMGGAAPRNRTVYYQSQFNPPPRQEPVSRDYTNYGWHQALSGAPAVAKAQAGYASVPYNTAQLSVNFTNFGWHGPTSTAPPVAKAQAGNSYVPYNTAQVAVFNYTNVGWYNPLSGAPAVAKAVQGDSFVPFNTAQTTPAVSTATAIPLDMGGTARTRQVYYQSNFVAPYVAPVVVVAATPYGWWNPFSSAPPVAKAPAADWSLPYTVVNAAGLAWQPPLASPLPLPAAQVGWSFVPFNTVQPVIVYSTATAIPLDAGSAAPRVRQVYYQARFAPVPYPVVQVTPVPPVVEPPPDELGGTTSPGSGGGFCRKKWKHLLDEIRQQLADEAASLKAAKKRKDDLEYARRLARIAALHDRALGLASGCAPQATQSINTLLDKIDRVEAAYQAALAREEDDEEVILLMLHS